MWNICRPAFGIVDLEIPLAKLNHYGVRGVSYDWFRSYLSNRPQYVSIHGYYSCLTNVNWGVPRICSRTPSLLLYINDLNQAIKFRTVYHFADNINLVYLGKSIKNLNKLVNIDLKSLG